MSSKPHPNYPVKRNRASESMVLKFHPDRRLAETDLKFIGYWYNDMSPDLPNPRGFEDRTWDEKEKRRVIEYLDNGEVYESWRGFSFCRYGCEIWNGTKCLTDGAWVWAEGFSHYLKEHHVKPDQEFIDHVLGRLSRKPIELVGLAGDIASPFERQS